MSDELLNAFKGIHSPSPSIAEKIEEISLDAKQREQISVIFDIGFEMGLAFGSQPAAPSKDSPAYKQIRAMYIAVAGPMMVQAFDEIMKDYEKQHP